MFRSLWAIIIERQQYESRSALLCCLAVAALWWLQNAVKISLPAKCRLVLRIVSLYVEGSRNSDYLGVDPLTLNRTAPVPAVAQRAGGLALSEGIRATRVYS